MTARRGKPLNFCDIRTGLLRGDPTRLIKVLGWIGDRPSVRVVRRNTSAGITDLSEFAALLCTALERTVDRGADRLRHRGNPLHRGAHHPEREAT